MSVKKVLINSVWFGVVPKLPTFINLLLLPFITPYLTPADYGVWGIVSSYVGIALSFASLGLFVHLTNSYYEYKQQFTIVWSRLMFLIIIAELFVASILFIVLFYSFNSYTLCQRICIATLSIVPIMTDSHSVLAKHLYPLRNKPRPLVLRNLLSSLCGICFTAISIIYFNAGYLGFILGLAVTSIANYCMFIKPFWIDEHIRPIREKSKRRIKEWLTIAYPAIPHTLGFLLLSSSSRIIMNLYGVPMDDIGIYTNGYTMGDYVNIASSSVVLAFVPQMQTAFREQRYRDFRYLYYFSQGIALYAIFMATLWMQEIYQLLIRNKALQEGVSVAQFACFANAIFPLYTFMSTVCFIEKKTMQLLWLVFLPGVINVLLCAICIPLYGYKAALYTTIVAYWLQAFVPFISRFHNRHINLWIPNILYLPLLIVVFTAFLLCSMFVNEMVITYKVLFTLFATCLLFSFLKKFSSYHIL